ncbi:MAG: SPOR domain-containing protein [Pseudomonadota bacterium]
MDNLVKQRLVGALILVALAVVFWPIIFVPTAQETSDVIVEVPAAPPIDRAPLPEPDNAGLRLGSEAEAQSDLSADVEPPPEDEELEKLPDRNSVLPTPELEEARESLREPAMDADGLPIAFSLQVATMGDKARAERLRDELVAAGYKGYVKRFRRDEKTLYRVLVGPKYNRNDLVTIKGVVDDRWRVESMIIRYLP